jgi:dephospho-CoA kinase
VVDADVLARVAVQPGSAALAEIAAAFGPGVLTADGSLDRPRLAALVFGDAAALARLEGIVHPVVRQLAAAAEAAAPDGSVVVHDQPLLAEQPGAWERFDVVVVVDCSPQTQLDRLVGARGMTEADAQARMASQATREQRLAIADEVVVNEGSLEDLDAAVGDLWERLRARLDRSG